LPLVSPLRYTLHIDDLYRRDGDRLTPLPTTRSFVQFPIRVAWLMRNPYPGGEIFAQLSDRPDFSNVQDSFAAAPEQTTGAFQSANIGANYFRLSADGESWTKPSQFQVVAGPSPITAPKIQVKTAHVVLFNGEARIEGRFLVTNPGLSGVILEISDSPNFPPERTQAGWIHQFFFTIRFIKAKRYTYARAA
jgi:hypothetical protein